MRDGFLKVSGMSAIDAIKDIVRPPFANYDIVVYFGCGLFSLPFIMHYTQQFRIEMANFSFDIEPAFVSTLVTTLSVLFSVYILGHIIAYIGSQLIEKMMDKLFGKASTIILLGSEIPRDGLSAMVKGQLKKNVAGNFTKFTVFSSVIRIIFHLPMTIWYLGVYIFSMFGFYQTRISKEVVASANEKIQAIESLNVEIKEDCLWFKPLEAVVMNSNPAATARMYNYLVISGLFRSVCTILLISAWFEMVYVIMRIMRYSAPKGLFMFGNETLLFQAISYGILCVVYLFSLFSYLKFQRRYVEDAIFAFVFTKA
jgi:hypothetical protein